MNREKEYDVVNFPIPEHCVGLVIGKGGSEVNAIHEKTGCRLQVHTEPSSTGFRMVEIHGPKNKIEMAKDCISQVVCRVNRPPPNSNSYGKPHGSSHNHFRSDRDPSKQTIVMSIPPNKVGSLIGKGGDTLRKLRNITNCNIQLIQENTAPNAVKPLKITGDAHNVDHAQRVVSEFLAGNENFLSVGHLGHDNGIGMIMTLHVKVPRASVGAIMGDHGSTVRDLSEKTGSKIHVLPDEDHKSMERMLALVGTRYQVHLAAAFIKDIIDASINGVNESVALFYLDVPSAKCGLVIGKGGETIKQINAESGAHCEVYRDGQPNPNVKTFVLRGTELQVEHAKHLIFTRVGDIPPNTPFVPNIPQSQLLLQPRLPMPQMQVQQQLQQHLSMQSQMSPQVHAQIQARLQAQFQAQMHVHQQMQARSPQQNTLTNVQMWTGQPIIQNQNPNHPQTQLLQQQIQQRQAQQQQLQQQQLQQQHFQQLQQQHIQQQRLLQQQSIAGQFNQSNFQGQYQQPNGWQNLLTQQPNQSGMQTGPRSQQFSPQQHMPNNQNYQRPYDPQQQQPRFSPQQSQELSPSPTSNPAQATYHEPLAYGQNFSQISKPMENKTRETGEPALKENEQQDSGSAEAVPDYSEEWYQYYISIKDHKNAENVRRRIEEIKAEKAKKAATASSSHPRR